MKYLKEQVFKNRKGESIQFNIVQNEKVEIKELTVVQLLQAFLNSYRPSVTPRPLIESVGEMRKLHKCLDILEDDKKFINGYAEFKDDEFELMKKIVMGMCIYSDTYAIHTPQIEDMFNTVKSELKEEDKNKIEQ